MAGYWTIKVVSELLKADGVGLGTDVFVLDQQKDGRGKMIYQARQIDQADFANHDAFIDAVQTAMRQVRDTIAEAANPAAHPQEMRQGDASPISHDPPKLDP